MDLLKNGGISCICNCIIRVGKLGNSFYNRGMKSYVNLKKWEIDTNVRIIGH